VLAKERKSRSYSFVKKARETIAVETAKAKKNLPAPSKYTINESQLYKPMRKY
jgi:hypothetical protein